jgi:hypothetical protein
VAGVEEARRSAVRGGAALHLGAGCLHRPAPLLEQLGHRLQVLRAPGAVERLTGLGVALDRQRVVLLGLPVGVRHLHVEVERANVVAEGDHVVAGDPTHLLELGLQRRLLALSLPPASEGEEGEREAQQQEQQDREAAPSLGGAAAAFGAAGARLPQAAHEVLEHRRSAVAALRLERLGGQRSRLTGRQHATGGAGPEAVADHRRVGARLAHRKGDLAQRRVGVATRLRRRRAGQDRQVERAGVAATNRLTQAVDRARR